MSRCHGENYIYKTEECLQEHTKYHHIAGRLETSYIKDKQYRMEYRKKDHRCWNKAGKEKCTILYTCRTEDPQRVMLFIDNEWRIYEDVFSCKEENPKEKRKEEILKEEECNEYELLTEECLDTHINYHHGIQNFKEGRRPMEHRCAWEGEKQKCKNLYEIVQGDRIKYIDESGRKYTDIKSFRNNKTKDIQTDK